MPGATRRSVPCSRRQIARPGGDACSAPAGRSETPTTGEPGAELPNWADDPNCDFSRGHAASSGGRGQRALHKRLGYFFGRQRRSLRCTPFQHFLDGERKKSESRIRSYWEGWSGPHPSKGSRINIQRHRRLPSRPRVMIGERRSRPRRDQMGRASDGYFSLILRRPSRRAGFSTTPLARRARSSSAGGSEKT